MEHCHTVIQEHGSIFLTLFLAGFFGGFTHCMGMCGPFVAAQVSAIGERIPLDKMSELRRLTGAALVPYHLGRITTYTMLGGIGALVAMSVKDILWFKYAAAGLLFIAGAMFVMQGLPKFVIPAKAGSQSKSLSLDASLRWYDNIIKYFALNPTGIRGYFLGVTLGFLPCGLIYASLAAAIAASSGDVVTGMMAMAAFAVGTIPALIVVGLGSNFILQKWRKQFNHLARMVMIVSGMVLMVMAYNFLK